MMWNVSKRNVHHYYSISTNINSLYLIISCLQLMIRLIYCNVVTSSNIAQRLNLRPPQFIGQLWHNLDVKNHTIIFSRYLTHSDSIKVKSYDEKKKSRFSEIF